MRLVILTKYLVVRNTKTNAMDMLDDMPIARAGPSNNSATRVQKRDPIPERIIAVR